MLRKIIKDLFKKTKSFFGSIVSVFSPSTLNSNCTIDDTKNSTEYYQKDGKSVFIQIEVDGPNASKYGSRHVKRVINNKFLLIYAVCTCTCAYICAIYFSRTSALQAQENVGLDDSALGNMIYFLRNLYSSATGGNHSAANNTTEISGSTNFTVSKAQNSEWDYLCNTGCGGIDPADIMKQLFMDYYQHFFFCPKAALNAFRNLFSRAIFRHDAAISTLILNDVECPDGRTSIMPDLTCFFKYVFEVIQDSSNNCTMIKCNNTVFLDLMVYFANTYDCLNSSSGCKVAYVYDCSNRMIRHSLPDSEIKEVTWQEIVNQLVEVCSTKVGGVTNVMCCNAHKMA